MQTPPISLFSPITLNNGLKMPCIGYGTYKLEDSKQRVIEAIRLGYRLIDTAQLYFNEEQIGEALETLFSSGEIKRQDVFIVTKLWQDQHEDPITSLKTSLQKLKLDYVDLFLIHWPLGVMNENGIPLKRVPLHILWGNLEKAVSMGLTKSLGVSNFNAQILLDLVSYAKILPVINQVEIHPYFNQKDLVDVCRKLKIELMAYMPACKGSSALRYPELMKKHDLFKEEIILKLSKKYNKTPIQIILNWHLGKNIIPLPRSNNIEHIKENLEAIAFKMENNEYEEINSLNMNMRLSVGKDKNFSEGFEIFA